MFAMSKKIFLACMLMLVVLATGVWQQDQIVFAKSQNTNIPETPLYPGLTWSNLGFSTQDIRISSDGDSVSLPGEGFFAEENFVSTLPQDVSNYYSNQQLEKSGWVSYDTFETAAGIRYVYYHETGAYLIVDFNECVDSAISICVAVWKSDPVDAAAIKPMASSERNFNPAVTATFTKKTPANGATNLNPASIVLSWNAYSPTPYKYSYCVKIGSACDANDPNWTSTYNTSITLTSFAYNTTYYWQVKAITCISCTPKTVVYADSGVAWTFKTKTASQAVIVGNAGVVGAVLSYTDSTPKTVTADGTGAYSITVPINWSGTLTPAKAGYTFSPKNASFSNLTAPQTIQNFTALPALLISGNVGISGVTLGYTDGTPQTVTSGTNGNYSIYVPADWSGTVTPSKAGYTFSPIIKTYSNLTTDQTAQNYTALVAISGNAGVGNVTLSYTDGTLKTVNADGAGGYTMNVPYGWTGTVVPSMSGFTFAPVSRAYSNLQSSQTSQNFTAVDAPIVLSSTRVNATPTSAASVDFTVTFSEAVTGVDSGDFVLTTTGVTGTSITGVSGSSAIYTVTVNTGSGSGTIRLDVADDDSVQDGSANRLGGVGAGNGNFTNGEIYEVNKITVRSVGTNDGWVLESMESSSVGGTLNKTSTTINLGDNASNSQYRAILSFDTSSLPDNAVITSVILKFKYAGVTGTNPFTTHGNLLVDVSSGSFTNDPALQLSDFKASANKSKMLTYTNTKVDNWYSQSFTPVDFPLVNPTGIMQFRLRFSMDDNNDFGADLLKIYSGNAVLADQPQLIIEYSVP